ncbi:flagellar export protein FliJ [Pseudoalteromonas tunicata]|jgi:flagellar FliJ protein|uniref:Flagellar FliJ protein n=1 Tax=Pseudoalteromonas tunicata D2 TaxID=87626 RepID=A4C6D0_9GAMM|nr:flagellar export protein FliJ [Pseudoalteromonas tunicata]ATC95509.1 flagellar FliJ protein [Pseudoalteromonas tunicata]AXT31083.1 flagellar export protein FliJ [Pseudoalteromonas tunicata]EAR29534.1 flagellar protein [Pseudoalteromonas tunicata D2]MDP4982536.1 flagellar export protein FliJ [Pseudoalteromonas tunicata]MDP5212438.1 flagellar export protein FliJ [Pseudoalteromonas tunicata]
MASKQLGLVLKINKDQEEARRAEYLKAQQYLLESQTKLTGLSDFRLDYMKQLHERGKQGLGSDKFNQFQLFIAKIESAMVQQNQVINTAKQVVEQRKSLWLAQQTKTSAIAKLIEKQDVKIQQKLQKDEQKMLDEYSTNAFMRLKKATLV